MKKTNSQKGQALILIALAMIGLVGFTALTVDGGRVLSDRRHAQNAADTSVLAAALKKIQGGTIQEAKDAGTTRAASNGYTTGTNGATVEVNFCNESGVTCDGMPTDANSSEYIRVKITSIVSTTFARVVGRQTVTNVVEAIARAQGSTSSGSPFGDAGMLAVRNDNYKCITINGGADLNIYGAGIKVSCTGSDAFYVAGNSNVNLDDDVTIAGCKGGNADVNFNNAGDGYVCNTPGQTLGQSDFASVPTTLPAPDCNSVPAAVAYTSGGNKVFPPGKYTSGQTVNSGQGILSAGTYCFLGGLNMNANASLVGTGDIKIVLGGDLNLANNSNNTFNDVKIYTTNATVSSKGSVYADSIRFFATGSGEFNQQNGSITSGNAYFYTYGGNFVINSQSVLDLTAPTSPDPFAGLLFYKPWNNTTPFNLNGGTNSVIRGTVLMPRTEVTLNGGSGMKIYGQIIAYTFIVDGGNQADIYYDPNDNYSPPSDPTIELTK